MWCILSHGPVARVISFNAVVIRQRTAKAKIEKVSLSGEDAVIMSAGLALSRECSLTHGNAKFETQVR